MTRWGWQPLHPQPVLLPPGAAPEPGGPSRSPAPGQGGFQEPVKALFPLLAGPSMFGTSSSPCGHQGPAKLFGIKSLISFPLGSKHAEKKDFQTSKPHLSLAGATQAPPSRPPCQHSLLTPAGSWRGPGGSGCVQPSLNYPTVFHLPSVLDEFSPASLGWCLSPILTLRSHKPDPLPHISLRSPQNPAPPVPDRTIWTGTSITPSSPKAPPG